jgi:hypothetical protein
MLLVFVAYAFIMNLNRPDDATVTESQQQMKIATDNIKSIPMSDFSEFRERLFPVKVSTL